MVFELKSSNMLLILKSETGDIISDELLKAVSWNMFAVHTTSATSFLFSKGLIL